MSRQFVEVEPAGRRTNCVGLQETVRPVEGVTLEETDKYPVKRLRLVIVVVEVAESPRLRVMLVGEDMLKSTTSTVIDVVWCDNPSLVPVTVTR